VHSDHDIFIQGVDQKKRLKLTFFSEKNLQNLLRECVQLHYSQGRIEGDDLDCYYVWDFEANKGSHFLALCTSHIVAMELTGSTFKIEDFSSFRKTTAVSAKDSVI
jgi:hypothetical protein